MQPNYQTKRRQVEALHVTAPDDEHRWCDTDACGKTPTLPDPSGDLPDGTRVRIVFEGPVKNWKRGRGSLETSGRGQLYFGLRDTDGATVEVLALPTPPRPDPLDGKPGSLWRDPETGGIYYRTANGKTSQGRPLLVLIEGNWNHDGWVLTAPNTEVVARLVQAEEGEQ